MGEHDRVMCPLVEEMIENIDCIENSDAVDGLIKKSSVPDRFKRKPEWENICMECQWLNY